MNRFFRFSLWLIGAAVTFVLLGHPAISDANSNITVLYSGKRTVDLFISDCGQGKMCELYRDDTLIVQNENLPAGGYYYSDSVAANETYFYKVKQYSYNEDTQKWDLTYTSPETEVDTAFIWGDLHNSDAWLDKLNRQSVDWDSTSRPYYCKGVTVSDGTLYISEGVEVVFCEKKAGQFTDLSGEIFADEVQFKRDDDTLYPEMAVSGGRLKNCSIQDGVTLKIEGDSGDYQKNRFNGHYLTLSGQHHVFQNNTGAAQVSLYNASQCTLNANTVDYIQISGNSNIIRQNTCQTIYVDWGDATLISENTILIGISLSAFAGNSQVEGNIITDKLGEGYTGISVEGSGNVLTENLISYRAAGIQASGNSAHANTFEGNIIKNSLHYGIELKFGAYENRIIKNTIARSGWSGIYLQDASATHIENNALDTNGTNSMQPWNGDGGIHITGYGGYLYNNEDGSVENIIVFNYIWGSHVGIAVLGDLSKQTGIHDNIITSNDIGIKLEGSGGVVYNNIFTNNQTHAIGNSPSAGGIDNHWQHDIAAVNQNILGGPYLGGNYWDDYTGADGNGDEIGDTAYPIDNSGGTAVSEDRYPLVPATHYAEISIAPESHDFGKIEVGKTSDTLSINLSNTGTAGVAAHVFLTGTGAQYFDITSDTCSGNITAPSSDCTVNVVFTPVTIGQASATLQVASTDIDHGIINIELSGNGAVISPGDVDGDFDVDLVDLMISLRSVAGMTPAGIDLRGDANGNGQIDLMDAVYILQVVGHQREGV